MRKSGVIIAIIVAVALAAGGLSLAWNVIKTVAYTFYSTFVAILPFLDLEQPLLCKLITIIIVQLLCGSGFYISHKTEATIGKIISGVVDAVATLLLFIA